VKVCEKYGKKKTFKLMCKLLLTSPWVYIDNNDSEAQQGRQRSHRMRGEDENGLPEFCRELFGVQHA
jgi:hypothetical protein